MPGIALLMLQVAATAAAPPATGPDERLLQPVPPKHCGGGGSEIVVCAKDQDAYRLHAVGPDIEPTGTLPKAEWRLFGNATAGVGTSQRNVGGFPSNAVMATVKIPF
jgi:hypothetical protein